VVVAATLVVVDRAVWSGSPTNLHRPTSAQTELGDGGNEPPTRRWPTAPPDRRRRRPAPTRRRRSHPYSVDQRSWRSGSPTESRPHRIPGRSFSRLTAPELLLFGESEIRCWKADTGKPVRFPSRGGWRRHAVRAARATKSRPRRARPAV
jgi:hypothetical protein